MARATNWRFDLPLANDEELRFFVEKAWGVHIPDVQICPHHTTPWQAFSDAYFGRHRVTVWEASRGFGGKSFLLAVLGLTEAATLKADVNVMGGSGEQSQRVHTYTVQFWDHPAAPRQLLVSDPTKMTTQLVWRNSIQTLMASQRSARGPHPPRLRLDEIDEMDVAILDAVMGQPMSREGIPAQTVLSSTHQHANGTMTEVLRRATDKGWPVYEWCYRESAEPHGWLPQAEIEAKRTDVTDAMWQVEYELQEPSPESRAIMPDAVRAMFKRSLGEFRGSNGESCVIEAPQEAGRYATGADWARKTDWTIIATMRANVTPMRVVAFQRMGRMPWPTMVGEFDKRVLAYRGVAAHDATGLGDVVGGYMSVDAQPVQMVGRARADLLSEYIAAIERGEIEAPFIDFMESEHRLASVEDVYGGGHSAHLPDSIAAMAVAYHALGKVLPPLQPMKITWRRN